MIDISENELDNILNNTIKDFQKNLELTKIKEDIIPDSIKWLFLSGKGGVGKTTCSCSLGIKYSEKFLKTNKKVLIVSTDPAHNLSDAFNQQFTDAPLLVDTFENLYCMEYDTKKGIKEAQEEFCKKYNVNEINKNFNYSQMSDLSDLFKKIPGIDEALGFLYLVKKLGKMDYDLIIFDTAPTGHTSKLLSYPQILKDSYNKMINKPMGQMFKMFINNSMNQGKDKLSEIIDRINKLNEKLTDPEYTTFICVGIPEFLSVYENERFIQDLFSMNINVSGIIINQLLSDKNCINDFWKKRKNMQDKYLNVIRDLYENDFFLCYNELQDEEIRGPQKLREFSDKLFKNKKLNMKGPSVNLENL